MQLFCLQVMTTFSFVYNYILHNIVIQQQQTNSPVALVEIFNKQHYYSSYTVCNTQHTAWMVGLRLQKTVLQALQVYNYDWCVSLSRAAETFV